MWTRIVAAVIVLAGAAPSPAQTPPVFDAVSVKPNSSNAGGTMFQILPGGKFMAINTTVHELLRAAYDFEFERFQMVGGPAWLDTDRFDVQATAREQATPVDVSLMVRALLTDRFRMVLRRQMREMPVFALVFARGDSRLGSQLKPAAGGCVPRVLAPAGPSAAVPKLPPCGFGYAPDAGDVQTMVGTGVTLEELAKRLRGLVQAIVVDRTGSTERYDLRLEYLPPRLGQPQDGGVSVFTGVHEQLGLRLDSRRAPVEVLVIESAEKPSAN